MADDHHRCRGWRVVFVGEDAAAERADAERREVIAGDELGAKRPGRRVDILPSDADARPARLKRRQRIELRRFGLQALEQGIREHAPSILWAALDAAVV